MNHPVLHMLLALLAIAAGCNMATLVSKLPAWITYTDKLSATCTNRIEPREMSSLLFARMKCMSVQRINLKCLQERSSWQPRVYKQPCGWIDSRQNTSMENWIIKVNRHFSLRLYFRQFNLPMPLGWCHRFQSSESLLFCTPVEKSNIRPEDECSPILCGKRSPFTLTWRSNTLGIHYLKLQEPPRMGHFLLHYQVQERREDNQTTKIVSQTTLVQNITFRMNLGSSFSFRHPQLRQLYSLHLLGQRINVLDLSLRLKESSNINVQLGVFEGPGAAEIHRHPDQEVLLEGKVIYFVTFQGFVQITCTLTECKKISLQYVWVGVFHFSPRFELAGYDTELQLKHDPQQCSSVYTDIWYCAFATRSNSEKNLRVFFNYITFDGPHFLGLMSEKYDCLMAGVTVADIMREQYLSGMMKLPITSIGGISEEFVIDTSLQELTTCSKLMYEKLGQNTYEFPMDTYVSVSDMVILVFYAYGAYINLSTSNVLLTITETPCDGVTIGCPQIPGDGYAEIGSKLIFSQKSRLILKRNMCDIGSMLTIGIFTEEAGTSIQINLCSHHNRNVTFIKILPYFEGKESCVFIQLDPYSRHKGAVECILSEANSQGDVLDASVNISVPQNVYCSEILDVKYLAVVLYNPEEEKVKYELSPETIKEFVEYTIMFDHHCARITIQTSLHCRSAENISKFELTEERIQYDIQRHKNMFICIDLSTTLFWNEHTYLVVAKSLVSEVLLSYFSSLRPFGDVSAAYLSEMLGAMELKLSIYINFGCPSICRHFDLHLAYMEPVEGKTVVIQWHLDMVNISWHVITTSQLLFPGTHWLIYIKQLFNLTSCGGAICSTLIQANDSTSRKGFERFDPNMLEVNVSDPSDFAQYIMLWTSNDYTWYEANTICTDLGMNLPSITSEQEYELVRRMLSGENYQASPFFKTVTPCKVNSPLCVIHIGMQVKVRQSLYANINFAGLINSFL